MTLKLNPTQELAAHHIQGPLLVLAGAGSGKTRIVTARVAYLLSIGIPSSEILALTFTNKAAAEMRERIRNLSNQSVLTSTFHSLAARILRESIHILGYSNDFTIYDEKDSYELLKHCIKSLGYKEEKSVFKSMKTAISNAKNELIPPHEIGLDSLEQTVQALKEVYTLYQQRLKEYNALDFDDLLYLTVKLFRESEEALLIYQKRWPFILIDEYQDTNYAQYLMTKMLAGPNQNLFVVGDPDQSIYSWRGANIQNILNFEQDFEGAKVVTLEQNYRSTNTILEAANHLILHNQERYEKNLWSDLGNGKPIGIYIAQHEVEEVDFVLNTLIQHHRKDQVPLKEAVIFYRTNAQSRAYEDALLKRDIPYIIVGGLSFYQRKEIKDLFAFLRLLVSNSDFLAFARTINLPKRGLGPKALDKLRMLSEETQTPILTTCYNVLNNPSGFKHLKLTKKQQEGLSNYLQVIHNLQKLLQEKAPLETVIEETIHQFGYLTYLKEDPETFQERRENLSELLSKAAEKDEEHPVSLPNFLEELTLKSAVDEGAFGEDAVRLMTLHNGKGLEFTLVFIVGMEEDLLPHINAKDSIEALEEERRLCYVGMTRAKRFLYLSASHYRMFWGAPKIMRISRFLGEIPEEHTETYSSEEQILEEEMGMPSGSVVFHKDFGQGIVKKSYHTSLGLTYDIFFPEEQMTRSLVAKYAKLSQIH